MKKTLLLAFVSFAVLTGCSKDPAASFSTPKTNYYINEVVSISNGTTGSNSYKWDFGDGQTSTEQNPRHVYNKKGIYQVKLTAGSSTSVHALRVYPGTASYEVDNATDADLPMVSFAADANGNIFDFIDHNIILAGGKSDTVFTLDPVIYVGGNIGTKKFIIVPPFTLNTLDHNKLVLAPGSQIYILNSIGKQVVQSQLTNKQAFNSVK
ncbi:PKD domain-containing protein [Mucilaginibacter pineti]|uniref:PKD domain-containing protein n=1 Tax=Mucilaginibacter pineti TaxID=1391627 RepID=A0A1G7AJ31_9SPHI|nr:PKD domain-containing protein [Mucilaginibacter pineti]SDE13876.1 PKD domain-containing protein [Mucilaginibacter pineti]